MDQFLGLSFLDCLNPNDFKNFKNHHSLIASPTLNFNLYYQKELLQQFQLMVSLILISSY